MKWNVGLALVLGLASLWAVPRAGAQEREPVRWRDDWARFRDWEYAVTPFLFLPILLRLLPNQDASWDGGILADEWVRDHASLPTGFLRDLSLRAGDAMIYSLVAFPFIDAALTAWRFDSPDAGGQQALAALEGIGAAMTMVFLTQFLVPRHRPFERQCANEWSYDEDCWTTTRYESFPSGHVAVAAAGASLICLQHLKMQTFGAPWDALACGIGIGVAAVASLSRIAAQVHWLSDVLVGALLGVVGGFVVPSALHYGFGNEG